MPTRTQPERRPVYKALHRSLTVCGVDRRLFFLALLMGAATFNLFYSFVAGLLMWGVPEECNQDEGCTPNPSCSPDTVR